MLKIKQYKQLAITILMMLPIWALAQTTCQGVLLEGNLLYEKGRVAEAIELILPCTTSDDEADVWKTYNLLAKAYLANNQYDKAKDATLQMLRLNPTYEPNPRTDPAGLIKLINQIDIVPQLTFGITFIYGANRTLVRSFATYVPIEYNKEYKELIGSQYSLAAGYNFTSNHKLEANLTYTTKKYELGYNVGQTHYTIGESINSLDLPIVYRYSLPSEKRLRFSALAGPYGSFILNSFNDLSIPSENVNVAHYSSLPRRNRFILGAVVGAGVMYKLHKSHLTFDARYYSAFTPINKAGSRFDNTTLIYDYFYLDDDFYVDNLSFTIGYHLYINYKVQP